MGGFHIRPFFYEAYGMNSAQKYVNHFHTYIIIIFLTNLINGGIIHLLNALTETVAKKKDLKRVGDGVSPAVSLL